MNDIIGNVSSVVKNALEMVASFAHNIDMSVVWIVVQIFGIFAAPVVPPTVLLAASLAQLVAVVVAIGLKVTVTHTQSSKPKPE